MRRISLRGTLNLMTDEFNDADMSGDADQPTTKRDIYRLDQKIDKIDSQFNSLRSEMQTMKSETQTMKSEVQTIKSEVQTIKSDIQTVKSDMQTMKQEILDHFDAVIENVEDELKGANRDEIELIKDVQQRHEQRIAQLETAAP